MNLFDIFQRYHDLIWAVQRIKHDMNVEMAEDHAQHVSISQPFDPHTGFKKM